MTLYANPVVGGGTEGGSGGGESEEAVLALPLLSLEGAAALYARLSRLPRERSVLLARSTEKAITISSISLAC